MRFVRKKVEYLRQQPEEVRLRAATIYTAIGGVAIFALWALVLLPVQLRFNGANTPDERRNGAVSGVVDIATPTPTPVPSPTPDPNIILENHDNRPSRNR